MWLAAVQAAQQQQQQQQQASSSSRSQDGTGASFMTLSALTVEGARRAMDGALAEAERHNYKVTVVIADHTGTPLLLERRGATPMSVELAIGKARTAVSSGRDTSTFERAVDGEQSTSGHGRPRAPRLALLTAPQLVCMEGAVPIIVDGICVGAVSVAGIRPDQDTVVARAGVAALLR